MTKNGPTSLKGWPTLPQHWLDVGLTLAQCDFVTLTFKVKEVTKVKFGFRSIAVEVTE